MTTNPHPLMITASDGRRVKNQRWQDWENGYQASCRDSLRLPADRCSSCGQPRSASRLGDCPKGEHY